MRLLHHTYYSCKHRLLAYLLSPEAQSALAYYRASQQTTARLLAHRHRFARYHRFVDITLTCAYSTVNRYFLAWAHLYNVACGYSSKRNIVHLVINYHVCQLGHKSHERTYGRSCRPLGTLLKTAARKHEGDNHHRRIIIGVPRYATRTPKLFAPKSIEHAEAERNDGRQRHKRVHIGRTMYELTPSIGVELASAIHHI